MGADEPDDLDALDELIRHLRPIEQLFKLMGEVGHDTDGAKLSRGCAEIGLSLTARFREHLERSFGRGGADSEST